MRPFRFLLAGLLLVALEAASALDLHSSFDLRVAAPPRLAHIGDERVLAYELQLVNRADTDLVLEQLDVLDADAPSSSLSSWRGHTLRDRVALSGTGRSAAATSTIPPGRHALAYIEVPLPARARTPRGLLHRLSFRRAGNVVEITGGPSVVIADRAAPLGPPLRGGPWLAIHLPAMPRSHRRVAFALDGALRIPARFAIDWVLLDDAGRGARGDERRVSNWHGYGKPVLAVADARVVATRDGMREGTTLESVQRPLQDASGNYISLDLGDGRHVHYEHLKPGSLRVRPGDRVQRGQVIAALGYTGDSNGPHLHMHVSSGPHPLAGEGLPLELERYDLLGSYESIEAFGAGQRWNDAPPGLRAQHERMPAPNSVIRFPDGSHETRGRTRSTRTKD